MAIQVASDIVLDVIRAANPVRTRQAAAKLGASSEVTASFDRELGTAQRTQGSAPELPLDGARPAGLAGLREKLGSGTSGIEPTLVSNTPRSKAYRDFEASVLKSFFETMLPSSDGGFYGQGTAGNVWRSMNADYLAQEFAKAGGIGIAQQLERQTAGPASAASITSAPQWPYFSQPSISALEL